MVFLQGLLTTHNLHREVHFMLRIYVKLMNVLQTYVMHVRTVDFSQICSTLFGQRLQGPDACWSGDTARALPTEKHGYRNLCTYGGVHEHFRRLGNML